MANGPGRAENSASKTRGSRSDWPVQRSGFSGKNGLDSHNPINASPVPKRPRTARAAPKPAAETTASEAERRRVRELLPAKGWPPRRRVASTCSFSISNGGHSTPNHSSLEIGNAGGRNRAKPSGQGAACQKLGRFGAADRGCREPQHLPWEGDKSPVQSGDKSPHLQKGAVGVALECGDSSPRSSQGDLSHPRSSIWATASGGPV